MTTQPSYTVKLTDPTVAAFGSDWILAHSVTVKPSTAHSEESAWRVHVEPKWGSRKIGTIRHTEVTGWVAELSKTRSATTVKRAHGLLAAILDSGRARPPYRVQPGA